MGTETEAKETAQAPATETVAAAPATFPAETSSAPAEAPKLPTETSTAPKAETAEVAPATSTTTASEGAATAEKAKETPAPSSVPTSTTSSAPAGAAKPAVSLKPVPLSSLPTTAADLTKYLTSIHKQAYDLISVLSTRPPKDPWKHHSSKKHGELHIETFARETLEQPPSSAAAPHAENEHWFARRTVHDLLDGVYVEEGGTGLRWADFTNYLFTNHAEHEQDYIGSVRRVDKIDSSEYETSGVKIDGWKDISFGIYAIHHSLPWPLHPRVFPIVLFTAMKEDDNEFVVVSLPVELPKDTEADVVDSNGKSTKKANVLEGMTCGRYVAVELVKRIDGEGAAKKAIWLMATASDAEGNLPMAMQKRSIPGTIAKDVPSFCDWIDKQSK